MQVKKTSWFPLIGFTTLITMAMSSAADIPTGDNVLAWSEETLEAVRSERIGTPAAARLYAMVHAAMFDAVNGIERAQSPLAGREYALLPLERRGPKRAAPEAAAIVAAHTILVNEVPELETEFNALLTEQLDALGHNHKVFRGARWGKFVAKKILALRAEDGTQISETLPAGAQPGEFRSDFTSAHYRLMTPFAIESSEPYESDGAPDLTSEEYAKAFNDVKLFGNGNEPNPTYDEIFLFWKGSGGSARPPGEWLKIAAVVAEQEGVTQSIFETTRLLALVGLAMGDAVLPAWNNKYNFQFWRPGTAVLEASYDGNPLTEADLTWVPRNGGLGSSPEHTSGQSTFAGAGSTILKGFFCSDEITFEFEGDTAIAGSRFFHSFTQAAEEAGRARILAGIHFEFSNQGGQWSGRELAKEILANSLTPLNPNTEDCSFE